MIVNGGKNVRNTSLLEGAIEMEIKNRFSGKTIYKSKKETIKETVIEAVENGTDLEGADLNGADLRGTDLYGADLRGTDLEGTDLREADFRGADLEGADLGGADLRGAILIGADLYGADLRGADLRGANLERADLRRIRIFKKTREQIEKWFDWKIVDEEVYNSDRLSQ